MSRKRGIITTHQYVSSEGDNNIAILSLFLLLFMQQEVFITIVFLQFSSMNAHHSWYIRFWPIDRFNLVRQTIITRVRQPIDLFNIVRQADLPPTKIRWTPEKRQSVGRRPTASKKKKEQQQQQEKGRRNNNNNKKKRKKRKKQIEISVEPIRAINKLLIRFFSYSFYSTLLRKGRVWYSRDFQSRITPQ